MCIFRPVAQAYVQIRLNNRTYKEQNQEPDSACLPQAKLGGVRAPRSGCTGGGQLRLRKPQTQRRPLGCSNCVAHPLPKGSLWGRQSEISASRYGSARCDRGRKVHGIGRQSWERRRPACFCADRTPTAYHGDTITCRLIRARDLDLSPARVHDIVHGKSAITANVALRLTKCFGNTPQFWLNLLAEFELRKAKRDVGRSIEARVSALDAAE